MLSANAGGTYQASVPDKSWFIWRETVSGAFVCLTCIDSAAGKTNAPVAFDALLRPGQIGAPPQPNADVMIPSSSPRVAVACGVVNGGYMVRYQYWSATDNSYCLPDGDMRNVSMTVTNGMQQTSSTQETVSQSVSSSASAGWGPVSASISYALDTSSSLSSSYEINEQTVRNDSVTLTNNSGKTLCYLAWQLVDVVQMYLTVDGKLAPSANIFSSASPLMYCGPYDPNGLPPNPGPTILLSDTEREVASAWAVPRPPLAELR
jgi:hypothetical protein